MACSGNCGACRGCGKALELTRGELDFMNTLAQIPFLPVARRSDDMIPVSLEDSLYSREEYSLILQVLEKKGLVDLDYSTPLKGFDMTAYADYPVHGTVALTARGQAVIDLIEKQGIL